MPRVARTLGRAALLAACLLGQARRGWADGGGVATETRDAFLNQVHAAQQLVSACGQAAGACDAGRVPADARVAALAGASSGGAGFFASWQWLREALMFAGQAKEPERRDAMQGAAEHLQVLAQEAVPGAAPGGSQEGISGAELARAHGAVSQVLSRQEFRPDAGPNWFDRRVSRVQSWLSELLFGMGRLGVRNPWLGPAIEWSCFGLALAGLALLVRRSLARQSLRIALGETAVARHAGRDRREWAALAEQRAAAKDWRDAVHCLYWAAIVLLEDRRAWAPNPTRTPREYLRLLSAESEAETVLRGLTRRFERVWYGSAEADEAEFRAARDEVTRLERLGSPRSWGSTARVPASGTAAAAGTA